ncbi:hypothetical protein RchiOBHm_Chr4g0434851 [Rosa chinensis]|uniref:DUF1639 family protein n=1 Tax=Rosa chinensis TaxID=74649 RepID=A0A2P6R1S7_ROSCH|nr:uncharacterized protein LOC112198129 [Rosa chinensis]PRQ40329.1 hypothetical protein RchiOBHm_Chr4g0434851 [Rosa chinensis]
MVYTGGSEERTRVVAAKSSSAAAGMNSERAAKPLHNFSLPWDLKWGNQRHLRCMKVDSDGDAAADFDRRSAVGVVRRRGGESEGLFDRRSRVRRQRIERAGDGEEEEGIEAVREKLMFEFKTAADKMKDAILRGEKEEVEEEDDHEPAPVAAAVVTDATAAAEEEDAEAVAAEEGGSSPAAAAVRPWNLRTRRAACKAPIGGGGGKGLKIEERKTNYSPLRSEGNNGGKSPRLVRGASGSGLEKDGPKERPKFSLTLSKKEIDEDFIQMLGHRPPRRPKKRPRAVQKQLDALFPGMWLTEVSADSYKVPEFPENVKR